MVDKKEETVATVEVKEEVKAPEVPTETEASEVLSPEEVEMAKTHGLVKDTKKEEVKAEEKKVEEKKEPEKKTEDKSKEEAEKALGEFRAGKEIDQDSEQKIIKHYNKNEVTLYFSMKADRRKRQEAQREKEALALKIDALSKEIAELRKPKEEIAEDTENEDELVTKKVLKERLSNLEKAKEEKEKQDKLEVEEKEKRRREEASALKTHWDTLEAEAKAKDPKFDIVMKLATEVIEKDKSKVFGESMAKAAVNMNPEEGEDVISKAYALAKLHPDYKAKCEDVIEDTGEEKKDAKTIEKILENSKKKTSANLTGSGGRIVTEDEITLDIAANMSDAAFAKLSQKTRDRLLAE